MDIRESSPISCPLGIVGEVVPNEDGYDPLGVQTPYEFVIIRQVGDLADYLYPEGLVVTSR